MLFSQDAYLNYFSELLGIVLTLILIPLILHLYYKRQKRTKRYLGATILLETLNKYLEILVPEPFKDSELGYILQEKGMSGMILFKIKNQEEIESYINNELIDKKKSKKKTKELADNYWKDISKSRDAVLEVFKMYEDVLPNNLFRSLYQLDYNIRTQRRLENKENLEIAIMAETISIVIHIFSEMIEKLTKKKKKVFFKDMNFKNKIKHQKEIP